MPRVNRRIIVSPAVLLAAALFVRGFPAYGADSVSGTVVPPVKDGEPEYRASGTLTTTDDGNNGLDGPAYTIDPHVNWQFWIKHIAAGWNGAGAIWVKVAIKGKHIHGPDHPAGVGSTYDKDPNSLDVKASITKNIPFGAAHAKFFTAYDKKKHSTSTGNPHWDHYTLEANVTAQHGTNNQLTGAYDVGAKHTGSKVRPSDLLKVSLGSGPPSGTTVHFDAPSGKLSFSIFAMDILDRIGGQSGGIDPVYAGDPFTSGQLAVTDLDYLGLDPDGLYRFSNGSATVTDPAGKFQFEGGFEEYVIDNTTGGSAVTSFALFDSLDVVDVEDAAEGPSQFLRDFVAIDLLGDGLSEGEWLSIQGVQLTFITETDLVAETAGFTQSATLPATVIISASKGIPIVPAFSWWGIIALFVAGSAVVWLLLRRRRTVRALRRAF